MIEWITFITNLLFSLSPLCNDDLQVSVSFRVNLAQCSVIAPRHMPRSHELGKTVGGKAGWWRPH